MSKIDKKIPIPETRGRPAKYSFLDSMKVGDSVIVANSNEATSAKRYMVRKGWKGISRKDGKKMRVWRTK